MGKKHKKAAAAQAWANRHPAANNANLEIELSFCWNSIAN